MIDDVASLLTGFPQVEFAFTYGSGAVEQGGYSYKRSAADLPMLDLILVVEDSVEWHKENMSLNPTHYSSLIPMGHVNVARFQENIPAHLWFNAYVPITTGQQKGRLLKYGIISKKHVLQDLSNWNDLYIAGRLHKPVHIIRPNEAIESAIVNNREQALRTALLLLPEKFTEVELYMAIASLSYVGDPRMIVGENPNKVRNLVTPVVHHYRSLYQTSFDSLAKDVQVMRTDSSENTFLQNIGPSARWKMCLELPGTLRTLLSIKSRERYMHSHAPKAATIRSALASIVSRSASMQTVKGLFTVGLMKSSSYIVAKMAKRFLTHT